jgi:NitT/TauT family transport system substrate-binding protein
MQSRRQFLFTGLPVVGGLGFAGVASLVSERRSFAAEAPPETTTVRLAKMPSICLAPQYVMDDLLREEGFTDVRYVAQSAATQHLAIARGELDFSGHFSAPAIIPIDAGEPIVMLAGVHPGCFELFAREGIRNVVDLKGKKVAVDAIGASSHVFLSVIAGFVGLDPTRDINWVATGQGKERDLFIDGKVDAFLGFPPDAQELRSRGVGHMIVSSTVDRPWSQYFCCMMTSNVDFVRRNPIATKRVVRAILRAADLCASEPMLVAQHLIDRKFDLRYDFALQTLKEIPYRSWREEDPEDTVRFYALRLHELGMIKSSPDKIIARGTDWRFLNEVKREMGI